MPTCRYHPSEPADRVCAPCLTSRLHTLSRREGEIRRLVDSFHVAAYPDDEELPVFTPHKLGKDMEKKPGASITSLMRSEAHLESAGSNAFFSCGSGRSADTTHSELDVKSAAAATPSRRAENHRFKAEQMAANFTTSFEDSPFPVVQPKHVEALPGHQLGAFSDRLCISDLITQSMRETDGKYKKASSFSHNSLPRRTTEAQDPSHSQGICLKTPVWKFKFFSRSSSFWRLGLKGNKVSPSKRDVEMDSRGSQKEVTRPSNNSRRLIASPPEDSARVWCASPMVTFREGSFRWGKSFDKGTGSGRKSGREENEASTTGVFRRVFDFTHKKGSSTEQKSETESTSSWGGILRAHEVPPRTHYDAEQAKLAANILSWMDGAVVQPATCSMVGKAREMSRYPEPELVVS